MVRATVFLMGLIALSACGGGGRWGHTRYYSALDGDEEDAIERSRDIPLEDVRRDPAAHRSSFVAWFGVVSHRDVGANGQASLRLSFRAPQPRNLCSDAAEETCRVTVSERTTGDFTALVTLRPDDADGELRVWEGSLIRVYGHPTGELDTDGNPIIRAEYYRHWPPRYYVTTAARATMRR
ncbi:MAG: hypothetical protein IT379_01255 [Deltaproteobacteria bacterium]|nr:hypothetical protein [Deltaproteobacteria bacterium]